MSSFEDLPQDTLITRNDHPGLYKRVEEATLITVLSNKGDKLLRAVEDHDEQLFVTRSYTFDAVHGIEITDEVKGEIGLPRVWEAMRAAFSKAKVPTVPSVLLENVNNYPFVVVSDYIEGEVPVTEASTEAKEEIAADLGRLVTADNGRGFVRLTLSPEIIQEGMFVTAPDEDGRISATFTDMDPLMRVKFTLTDDDRRAIFMDRAADYLWRWSSEEERPQVIAKFLMNLDSSIKNFDIKGGVAAAFIRAHRMSQGMDPDRASIN